VADAGVSGFSRVRERHGDVLAIVAPPRTASTALARILWNHPSVGFYSHEPFEPTWYRGAGPEVAAELLESATPVGELDPSRSAPVGRALVVKEMTFQVGDRFPLLAALATRPIVFVIRDPRLSIASRMKVLGRSGRPELFPLRESGWEDLMRQLDHVRSEGIPHVVVDSRDVRTEPERVVPALLAKLGLDYDPALLRWGSSPATGLSAVSGNEDPFYQRVLTSGGIEAPTEEVPQLDSFPSDGGFRQHVAECLARYEELCGSTGPTDQ
jgi:sulfotransferase family protein